MTRASEGAIGVVLMAVAIIGLIVLVASQLGCTTRTTRTVLVTAGRAATEAQGYIGTGCDEVEKRCKTNPCPALDKCHDAERQYLIAVKLMLPALTTLNEVIP